MTENIFEVKWNTWTKNISPKMKIEENIGKSFINLSLKSVPTYDKNKEKNTDLIILKFKFFVYKKQVKLWETFETYIINKSGFLKNCKHIPHKLVRKTEYLTMKNN
jgi:hypothetical protein